ncbi:MAG: UDP-N-acetylmuramoyl-L-alanine--D-glutamate ligase [Brevinematia bacterium]
MKDRNILLLGFTERTTYSVARVLGKNNTILISDKVCDEGKLSLLSKLKNSGIEAINLLGDQSTSILDNYRVDIVIVSPGVPLDIPVVVEAKRRKIPVIGDIELFYSFFPENFYIGITGTDGKTTTTTLIYEILKNEKKAFLAGNVGIPIFSIFESVLPESYLVLELSSFQLEAIEKFRPNVAVFLNLAEDHLDRYNSMTEYLEAKRRIFINQKDSDFAIVNLDSPYFGEITRGLMSHLLTFSIKNEKADIYFKNDFIFLEGKPFIKRDEIFIKGIHNVENSMAAILAARIVGVSDESIKKTLRSFKGVEHRIEFVRNINGVEFYNDSKSTTVNSLEKALMSFENPVILIAGGRDKGLDFTRLKDLVREKLKLLILIGEAREKIQRELDFEPFVYSASLEEAVKIAYKNSLPGDVVLLSPGCASFDMFKNYEERGKLFKECVNLL